MTDIFDLSDSAVDRVAAADPMLATYQGISGHDHAWPDLSPAGHASNRALHTELRDSAQACETPDERHQLAQRVLIEHCESAIRFHDSGGHQVSLNNISSAHQEIRFVFGSQSDETNDDWDALIERVSTIGPVLAGFRETLDEGRRVGNVVSQRQVHAVIEQGESAAGDESSFDSLRSRLIDSPVDTGSFAGGLEESIESAKHAFDDFNRYLRNEYLPDATSVDAVGEERYSHAAEMFLGTHLDLRETYRWGWNEVERLWVDMQAACREINATVPAAQVLHDLQTQPEYAASGIEEFIAIMTDRQHDALEKLEGVHFDVPAGVRNIEVQVEPAGGALAAHYVGPSEDFSRPGSVWYPIDGQHHFPLFGEITTAYHEGFPGHHLQVGVQMTLRDELSRFHRSVVWYPGSGEGWALYAEHLMGELGYLERPEYLVGLLSAQLIRAARVAIDIGVHLELPIPDDVSFHPGERWTFDIAHELLTTRGFMLEDAATSEVLRYMGWPGQAISYKVGEKAILDLRSEWNASGTADLKRFHSTVLGVGSVGLDLLREHVTSHIPV